VSLTYKQTGLTHYFNLFFCFIDYHYLKIKQTPTNGSPGFVKLFFLNELHT
jgi:hypothetical protein